MLSKRLTACVTHGILFSTAPILPTFVASFGRCIKMLMVPCSVLCGTRTRELFAIAWRPSSIWLMTPTKTRPHKPMLAEWTSEILSLSLMQFHLDKHASAHSGHSDFTRGGNAWALGSSPLVQSRIPPCNQSPRQCHSMFAAREARWANCSRLPSQC